VQRLVLPALTSRAISSSRRGSAVNPPFLRGSLAPCASSPARWGSAIAPVRSPAGAVLDGLTTRPFFRGWILLTEQLIQAWPTRTGWLG
jgi:hypothetical protein